MNHPQTIKPLTQDLTENERTVGFLSGDQPGPLLIVLSGLHGNEKAGVTALKKIFSELNQRGGVKRGAVVGLQGNIAALEKGIRYLEEDMNRIWLPSIIDQVRSEPLSGISTPERREMKHLLRIIDQVMLMESAPVIAADLHSFSADGPPFLLTAEKEEQLDLLSPLEVPMVFGIEKTLQGTALNYFEELGCITFGMEGGQHANPLTAYNLTAAMLTLMHNMDLISSEWFDNYDAYVKHLSRQNKTMPDRVEVVYQHIIEPGDEFRMKPGYGNFQPVKKGEWLASDRNGRIFAEYDGYMLMPLYQSQGNDGFFIVQEQN